ncbi:disulfide isomerase DsbC N-terminal domain-containing protein [Aurantiacibacter zhengii]|uniref:Disulphide bond isomerase DsbC/G N-terminal domain-containing protein n=1 Tax=Aurantiacibacter zhengii TaxID=2307003 RepID=A0A418NQ69_9SPHN|nr:disulfide isomerase DsbC N-terminal domain-containing protein [Aurantiacibacter zhengii]RIV84600.1 hypothetical protein D2V07_13505 [Aurantiacibacter zhengii]
MNYSNQRPGLKARAAHISLAAASAAALLTSGVAIVTAMPAQAAITRDVVEALKLRLPRTPIDALDCTTFAPWCEVVSGETLFYIDEAARYLFVGRLYDMEERRDVTAARLLELNPDLLAAGAARHAGEDTGGRHDVAETRDRQVATHVDLKALPKEGAILWGNPKGPKLVVFSDFQCGYCKRLGNLADHYRTADPIARRFFAQDLQIAFLIAAGGLALLRLPAFLRRLDRRLSEGSSRHG